MTDLKGVCTPICTPFNGERPWPVMPLDADHRAGPSADMARCPEGSADTR